MRSGSSQIAVAIHSAIEIDPVLRDELEAWDHEQFGQIPYQWTSAEWYAEARIDGRLAGALEIVTRAVGVGDESARVAGIGGVKIRPEFRLRGVASAMLSAGAADARSAQRRVRPAHLSTPGSTGLCEGRMGPRHRTDPLLAAIGNQVLSRRHDGATAQIPTMARRPDRPARQSLVVGRSFIPKKSVARAARP